MKILVIGCGSIGRRHYRLLKEMDIDAIAYDVSEEALRTLVKELGAASVCIGNLGDVLWTHKPDGVIIATPNHLHIPSALQCLGHEIPLLIEKPLAHTVAEAHKLLWANAGGECGDGPDVAVLVGYCLRHHEGYRRVKTLLDEGALGTIRHASFRFGHDLRQWRPGVDYRAGYACRRELGGGILLDASHELDLCNWWFGKPHKVMAMVRNTGALEGLETEDVADVLIEYESGLQASVHLDYLDKEYNRGCRIVGDNGTLRFKMFPDGYEIWRDPEGGYEGADVERDSMYRNQLAHFVRVIQGQETPVCPGADGLSTLKVASAARESAESVKMVYL